MLRSLLLCCLMAFLTSKAHVTFTNLKCSYTNITFGEYSQCFIKAVNRTHKYVNIYGKLYFRPLNNIMINFKFMRYDHGYKPFFFEITFDACKYLKNPRNPIVNLVYKTFRDRSNMNHTCPYDHNIIVDKLWTGNLDRDFGKYIPIRSGDYAIFSTFYTQKIPFTTVNIYFRITD